MGGEVKVLGTWTSPFSKRVEMALKMKGVEYEYIEEDIKNKSPLLLQTNPVHKKVPVLLHNGIAIAESMIIVEYIDEVWNGPPILPVDPLQRSKARFWAKFIDDKGPSMWKACWSKGEEQEKLVKESTDALELLENEIKGKKFFGGDKIGFVDVAANAVAYWIPIFSELGEVELMSEKKFPNLCRWAKEYCSLAIVKDFLPNKEAMVEKFNPK